ncbi:MAG: LamG-like jellyroll fold domain-containing protein [Bacteroidota bacterium]
MSLLVSTPRQRRLRVNHERLLEFNGANQYIDLGTFAPLNYSGSFAVSSIASFTENHPNGGGTSSTVFCKTLSVGSVPIRIAYGNAINQLSFVIHTNNGPVQPPNISLQANKLYHIVCSWNQDTGELQIFVNGRLESEIVAPSGTTIDNDGAEQTRIGGNAAAGASTQVMSGLLNNLILFSRAITQEEVGELLAKGGVVPNSLHDRVIGFWPLTQKAYGYGTSDLNDSDNNADYEGVVSTLESGTVTLDNFETNALVEVRNSGGARTPVTSDSVQWKYDFGQPVTRNKLVIRFWQNVDQGGGDTIRVTVFGSDDDVSYMELAQEEVEASRTDLVNTFSEIQLNDQKLPARFYRILAENTTNQIPEFRLQYALLLEPPFVVNDTSERYNHAKSFLRKDDFLNDSLGNLIVNGGGSFGNVSFNNGICILEQTSSTLNQNHGIQGANVVLENGRLYRFRVGYSSNVSNTSSLRIQVLNYSILENFSPGSSGVFEVDIIGTGAQAFAIVGNGGITPTPGDIYNISFFELYEVGKEPLSATHGKLINFSRDQVDPRTTQGSQTIIKNVYTKELESAFGLNFINSDTRRSFSIPFTDDFLFGTNDFQFKIKARNNFGADYPTGTINEILFSHRGTRVINITLLSANQLIGTGGNTGLRLDFRSNGRSVLGDWRSHKKVVDEFTITKIGGDANNWEILADGIPMRSTSLSSNNLLDTDSFDFNTTSYVGEDAVGGASNTLVINRIRMSNNNTLVFDCNFHKTFGRELTDIQNGNTINELNANFSDSEIAIGGSAWVDAQSLAPPITRALKVTNGKFGQTKVNFDPSPALNDITGHAGYTWVFKFRLDTESVSARKYIARLGSGSDALFSIDPSKNVGFFSNGELVNLSGGGTNFQATIGAQGLDTVLTLIFVHVIGDTGNMDRNSAYGFLNNAIPTGVIGQTRANDISTVSAKFQVGSDPTAGSGNETLDGHLINYQIYNTAITKFDTGGRGKFTKDIAELVADFNIADRFKAYLIANWQFQTAVEGANEPEIKNLAPAANFPVGSATQPSDWDLEMFGFSGATVAERLNDLLSNIVDITTLR